VFLDEIGDMSPDLQVKVLKVLEEGEFEPVGGAKTLKVDVRIIAATHRDLSEEVQKGNFREDLFYRLYVIPMNLPALRDRPEDIRIWFITSWNRPIARIVVRSRASARMRWKPWWPRLAGKRARAEEPRRAPDRAQGQRLISRRDLPAEMRAGTRAVECPVMIEISKKASASTAPSPSSRKP